MKTESKIMNHTGDVFSVINIDADQIHRKSTNYILSFLRIEYRWSSSEENLILLQCTDGEE